MTEPSFVTTPQARGLSITALTLGLLSIVCAIFFASTSAGPLLLIAGGTAGLAALVVGVIALKKRQPKAPAVIGLILGALVLLLSLAIFAFALLFIGAMTLESM